MSYGGRPRTHDAPPKTLGFTYDERLRERIDELAQEQGISRSAAIAALVREGLTRHEREVVASDD